jgi:hypothetical protein
LKKTRNFMSPVTFLVNLRMVRVIDGNITFHLIVSSFVHLMKALKYLYLSSSLSQLCAQTFFWRLLLFFYLLYLDLLQLFRDER